MTRTCLHCRNPITDAAAPEGYCCLGCATVAALLKGGSLERYYDFQGGAVAPVSLPARPRDLAWLEAPLAEAERLAGSGLARLQVDVQGLRCSGCVWLLSELFKRQPGAVEALIDPGVGRATLTFRAGQCDVAAYLRELERFGYGAGPSLKEQADASDATLGRLGVCAALTMNSMVFTAAFYFGLAPRDGDVFTVLRWLNFALGLGVVLVGGREFFERSLRGLRLGLVPFELPISLGILLAFGGSTALLLRDPSTFSYFDTVDTFTTLMLVGRWLQRRVLVQNRRRLLADEGIAGLFARRLSGERVEAVPAARVEAGDHLLVPPGDLLVTPARVLDAEASFSLDWINGESVPRTFARGETVPAGAFNAQPSAARLEAAQPFAASSLLSLLESRGDEEPVAGSYGALLSVIGRYYVPAVLTLATLTFAWWLRTDVGQAIRATTSVLVVTCPCALGLAIPLAYQLTAAGLRRRGLFVCRDSFLDRAAQVRRVAFDKTGTLTLGGLRLTNPGALQALSGEEQALLYNLACRSAHPRSQCVAAALPASAARFDADASVREVAGQGLELTDAQGRTARLGRPGWLAGPSTSLRCAQGERSKGAEVDSEPVHPERSAEGAESKGPDENELWFAVDGQVRARLALEEQLRSDARAEVAALQARGCEVAILSGDAQARVDRVAATLGVPAGLARGGLSPEGKAGWLAERQGEGDTLLVGDGLNDRPAMAAALCGGTPAVDRPTLAARADFYFLTSGLQCVRAALEAAQRLRRTTQVIQGAALTYNVLAVAGAMSGRVGPLAAALAMPASSVLILLYTARAARVPEAAQAQAPSLHNRAPAMEASA